MDTATVTHQFTVEDVEYLRHGTKPLLAAPVRPAGKGPFPAVVELHGGAWCNGDRLGERSRHEALAKAGSSSPRSISARPRKAPIRAASPTSTTRSAG